jgi:dephospho-CoA kinase
VRIELQHRNRPFVLGLTGSIGMGKSTVAQMFRDEGIAVFDADAEVHKLQGPGGKLLPAIEEAFPGTTGPDGVDRKELGQAVFGNPDRMSVLEGIVHPAVQEARAFFQKSHAGDAIIVYDIPLLFETSKDHGLDAVVVVSAPPEVQKQRVLARPNMDEQRFENILAMQIPDAEKQARADHVISTGCSLEETRNAVKLLVRNLMQTLA